MVRRYIRLQPREKALSVIRKTAAGQRALDALGSMVEIRFLCRQVAIKVVARLVEKVGESITVRLRRTDFSQGTFNPIFI
jgi:hypothetical protein